MAKLPNPPDDHPSGDSGSKAFTDLYTAHYGHVLAYAQRRTTQDSNARDVTAETFLIAWRRLDVALPGGLPWLYTTASLVLANHHRTHRRATAITLRLATDSSTDGNEPIIARPHLRGLAHPDPAAAHADQDEVRRAVRQLPDRDRELLLLTVWEHLDVTTAANIVGCSTAAAHVRLHRARRKLRDLLTSTSAAPSTARCPVTQEQEGGAAPTPPSPLSAASWTPRPEEDC